MGWTLNASAAPTVITMNPNPLDAGNVLIGSTGTSPDGTLSSNNNVRVDLVVTNQCSGTGQGTFTLSQTTNINLNNPATITVSYTPTTGGTRTCTVSVRDSGNNSNYGSFSVRGTGQNPPTISVTGMTDFGAVRWNDAAPTHTTSRTFTVTNTGDVTLDVTDVTIGGTNAGDFSITAGSTPQSILPNNSKSWTVTFDPSAGGTRSATLTFTSNDPNNPTHTLNLTGTGTNAVISVPANADFGIVVAGSSGSLDVTVSNIGGSPKGNLGVASATITDTSGWFTFSGCGSGTNCTFSPALSIANSAVVGVRCSPPADATLNQMATATLSFSSDSDPVASPADTATLKCTAGKSDLVLTKNTVQFTPQLVGTTTTMPVTLDVSNNGNVGATFYLQRTGANAAAFAATTSTGCGTSSSNQCSLSPAATVTINVTFTPGAEGDISAGLTLVSSPASPQAVLTGRGIDRHIHFVDSVQFPDTFRNPGDTATIQPVTIENIGEYPLHVSSVLLDGAPNWQLAEQLAPFDVPGLSSHDVMVMFTPVTAGKAPDGTLAVMSDDRQNPLLNVILSGNGKDRNVSMGPPVIDFGNTGAGVPVTLTSLKNPDDWLTVANLDDTKFRIREIKFDMPDVFKVQTLSGESISDMDLPAGATSQFEVVFLPPDVGEYVGNMTLYLDQDPLGQRTIEVRGRALFVDAHGGGGFGCSAGRGAGSGMLLVLAALLRGKRRRG